MFRFLTIFFTLFCVHGMHAQSDTLNHKDRHGQKQGRWIFYGKDRPPAGYPTNGKIEEGVYDSDRKEGLWIKYWEDGITPKLKGTYVQNRPNGAYWKYHRNGNLKEQGEFRRNRYAGTHTKYDEEGRLFFYCTYNDEGKKIDTAFAYFTSGCLKAIEVMDSSGVPISTALYREDSCDQILEVVKHGYVRNETVTHGPKWKNDTTSFVYKVDSSLNKEGTWRDSEEYLIDYSDSSLQSNLVNDKKYNDQREIIFHGTFKEGKVWGGKMYFYDLDMILLRIEVWSDGEFLKVGRL
ncbi:MAG: hypothetical protein P8P74_12785 [Crocinitomicaceae bacterium]|nr:hypothetical protein [Crocinitomicaceae bacterium]